MQLRADRGGLGPSSCIAGQIAVQPGPGAPSGASVPWLQHGFSAGTRSRPRPLSPCARSSRHPSHVDFFAGDRPRTLNTPQPCWQAVSFLQTPDESRTSPRRQCAFQRYRTLGSRLRPSASSVASSPAAASSSAALPAAAAAAAAYCCPPLMLMVMMPMKKNMGGGVVAVAVIDEGVEDGDEDAMKENRRRRMLPRAAAAAVDDDEQEDVAAAADATMP